MVSNVASHQMHAATCGCYIPGAKEYTNNCAAEIAAEAKCDTTLRKLDAECSAENWRGSS